MGQHHHNGNSIRKAAGLPMPPKDQPTMILPLGDDYVCLGFALDPAIDKDGNVCALLSVIAGKHSPIAGITAGKFMIGELGKLPIANVKTMVDRMLNPELADPEPVAEEVKPA